jgi:hypothetical protein
MIKDNYEVVRYFQDGRAPIVQKQNLTLEKAQEWCNDPETSSKTARHTQGTVKQRNLDRGQYHWFDGYREMK